METIIKENGKSKSAEFCLTKTLTPREVETYFTKVFELTQAGDEFPVNLDEVWPLVYGRKDKAVRVLKSDFVETEDYIMQTFDNEPLPQNGERSNNGKFSGQNRIDYYLSVPCLEYFIVKKVRPVFDVYRQVFHRAVNTTKNDKPDQNILPGFHLPKTMMIGGSAVWTILLDGILYYRLKDILVAADMYKYERSVRYTNHAAFKPYVYWFNDKIGNKPKRYLTKDGVLLVLSNTRMTGNPKLPLFLDSFKSGIENAGKRTENKSIKTGNIDLKKFLDFIIRVPDDGSREFLYDIYEKLNKQLL
jgi:hypothetical protein